MALKLVRKGDTSYLQDHNLLKNTNLSDQHPIKAITGLQEALNDTDSRLKKIEDECIGDSSNKPGNAINKDEVESMISDILKTKLSEANDELLYLSSIIINLHLDNIKTHIKYDKELKLASNYSGNYFIDANLDSIEKEGV